MADRPPLHTLVYGDSGAGKTTFASSFPKPMLVASFDPGGKDMPYLKRGKPSEPFWDDADTPCVNVISNRTGEVIVRVEHYSDEDPTQPKAWERFRRRMAGIQHEYERWRTIVFDSTTFAELAARMEAQYVVNKASREPRQWFGASTDALEQMLMFRFATMPLNTIVICHIDEDKDEAHGHQVRAPKAPGRLRKGLPSAYGEFYRAYVRKTANESEYLLQTQSDNLWNAATQIDAPNPALPLYSALWANFDAQR